MDLKMLDILVDCMAIRMHLVSCNIFIAFFRCLLVYVYASVGCQWVIPRGHKCYDTAS